jgi:hypothetical protein
MLLQADVALLREYVKLPSSHCDTRRQNGLRQLANEGLAADVDLRRVPMHLRTRVGSVLLAGAVAGGLLAASAGAASASSYPIFSSGGVTGCFLFPANPHTVSHNSSCTGADDVKRTVYFTAYGSLIATPYAGQYMHTMTITKLDFHFYSQPNGYPWIEWLRGTITYSINGGSQATRTLGGGCTAGTNSLSGSDTSHMTEHFTCVPSLSSGQAISWSWLGTNGTGTMGWAMFNLWGDSGGSPIVNDPASGAHMVAWNSGWLTTSL